VFRLRICHNRCIARSLRWNRRCKLSTQLLRAIAFGNPSTERVNIARTFRLSRRVRGQDLMDFDPAWAGRPQTRFPCPVACPAASFLPVFDARSPPLGSQLCPSSERTFPANVDYNRFQGFFPLRSLTLLTDDDGPDVRWAAEAHSTSSFALRPVAFNLLHRAYTLAQIRACSRITA